MRFSNQVVLRPRDQIYAGSGSAASYSFTAPYNRLFIPGPGDSRTALGGGYSGTYGSGNGLVNSITSANGVGADGVVATMLNNRLRHGLVINPGIGGATAVHCMAYPRPAKNSNNSSGSITASVLTITAAGGGDGFAIGQLITGTNVLPNTKIVNQLTGSAGAAGTYTVDVDHGAGTGPITDIKPYYLYGSGKTIADTAANEAAIIMLWAGTNNSGNAAELTAMDTAIKGLTDTSYAYPGYGGPLPHYSGLAKSIILLNETRKGVTALNVVNPTFQVSGATAAQWKNYADTLLLYDWNSSDDTRRNSHVIAVNTFDDPLIADLPDTTNYNPLGGWWADGQHQAMTVVWALGKIISVPVAAVIDASVDYARLSRVSTASTFFTQNCLFVTQTGGSNAISGGHTLVGTLPSGWQFSTTATSGLTITVSYVALGGDLGYEMVVQITGTASADTTLNMINSASAPQLAGINLATDTIRGSARTKLDITAGNISLNTWNLQLVGSSAANKMSSIIGLQGIAAGYGNNAAYPMFLENAYAAIDHSTDYWTEVTNNVSLVGFATGNPTIISLTNSIAIRGSVAVDVTLRINQVGVAKVTD